MTKAHHFNRTRSRSFPITTGTDFSHVDIMVNSKVFVICPSRLGKNQKKILSEGRNSVDGCVRLRNAYPAMSLLPTSESKHRRSHIVLNIGGKFMQLIGKAEIWIRPCQYFKNS